jgi:hypothetical protein
VLLEVLPHAEGASVSGEQHRSYVRIAGGAVQRVAQGFLEFDIERVHRRGTIQGDDGETLGDFVLHGIGHAAQHGARPGARETGPPRGRRQNDPARGGEGEPYGITDASPNCVVLRFAADPGGGRKAGGCWSSRPRMRDNERRGNVFEADEVCPPRAVG